MVMGVIGWIVLGLIAGYIASTLVNKRGEGLAFDILLGIVGAVIGGWIFNAAGANRRDGLQSLEPPGRGGRGGGIPGSLACHPSLGLARMNFTTLM
jgi:uncharacterized membrane protein YeaQ/YmgE (transglycosylase-associated protein family)